MSFNTQKLLIFVKSNLLDQWDVSNRDDCHFCACFLWPTGWEITRILTSSLAPKKKITWSGKQNYPTNLVLLLPRLSYEGEINIWYLDHCVLGSLLYQLNLHPTLYNPCAIQILPFSVCAMMKVGNHHDLDHFFVPFASPSSSVSSRGKSFPFYPSQYVAYSGLKI